jgi:hypothetical protein
MHKGPRGTEAVESGHVVTVGTLRAHHPGTAGVQGDTDHIVATYPINTQLGLRGPDVSNTSRDGLGVGDETDPAYTLQANHTHAVAFQLNGDRHNPGVSVSEDVAFCLPANPMSDRGQAVAQPVAFDTTQITSPQNYSNPQPGDPCHPLAAGAHPPAVAIDAAHAFKVRGGCEGGGKGYLGSDEVAFTLSTNQDQHIFSEATHEVAGTFKACAGSGGWSNSVDHAAAGYMALAPASTVRRLTPVECERLQGFPDNFTAIPWRKKGAEDCPDGPRYKALGNSMAVPVMRWIGERIRLIDDYISII